MVLKTFKRYEQKYLIDAFDLKLLLPEIKRHMTPDAYCTDGKCYSVYNIYFDNDTNDIIRHSFSKPYFKEKLRLRSYNPDPGPGDIIFIEIKKKIGKIVCKRRTVMTCSDTAAFLDTFKYPGSCDFMQRQVLGEIEYFININSVKPVVYISYDRYAFFDNDDPDFRLTFDSNIHARRDKLNFNCGTDGETLLEEDQYLMEIKIDGAVPLWLVHILSEMSIFSTNFSKYGIEYSTYHKSPDTKKTNYNAQYAGSII